MEKKQGNSEIGMQADSFEAAEAGTSTDSSAFFDQLDNEVNGGIREESTEVTQSQESGSEQVTHTQHDNGSNNVEQSNLGEDFIFDQQEAMVNPDSDSAKMMNAHVDKMVQHRVGDMLNAEKQRAAQIQQAKAREAEEAAFRAKHNMSNEDFTAFKAKAQEHVMTLDDVNYLLNRNQNNENVANSTKKDMLNQMKNVRNMPTSASGANSQATQRSESDKIFDAISGIDNSVDNLFG